MFYYYQIICNIYLLFIFNLPWKVSVDFGIFKCRDRLEHLFTVASLRSQASKTNIKTAHK